jgi:proteic killer suppression protein
MKIAFEKAYLHDLYEMGKTTDKKHRFQPHVVNGYVKCVRILHKATRMEELFLIKSLNYERLRGNKKGLSSVRINDQYRLEFREISNADSLYGVEICSLTDITNHYT